MRSLQLLTLTAATLLMGACGHMHHHGHGNDGGAANTSAPTAPMSVTTSVPVLSGGYAKVGAPAGAAVYFIHLKNGDTVNGPVTVQFGLKGMGVAPAGVEKAGTGHHHLLVDLAALDVNAPLPADDQHRHFGAGQTETLLALKPGVHTLQLLLGDQNHIPHHPPVMSERITITVK